MKNTEYKTMPSEFYPCDNLKKIEGVVLLNQKIEELEDKIKIIEKKLELSKININE